MRTVIRVFLVEIGKAEVTKSVRDVRDDKIIEKVFWPISLVPRSVQYQCEACRVLADNNSRQLGYFSILASQSGDSEKLLTLRHEHERRFIATVTSYSNGIVDQTNRIKTKFVKK